MTNLIIHVEQVQSYINLHNLRSGSDVDILKASIQEMYHVMDTCGGCHHSRELTQGIMAMRDVVNDYKTVINHLIVSSANPVRASVLEKNAQEMGRDSSL